MAVLKTWSQHRAVRAARRHADEQLLASRLPSPRLAWRIAELTSPVHRLALGRALTDVVHASDERLLPSVKPIDRGAVRNYRAQLLELAAALFDERRSVSPRGVLLVEALLAGGPLYGDGSLRTALLAIEEEL